MKISKPKRHCTGCRNAYFVIMFKNNCVSTPPPQKSYKIRNNTTRKMNSVAQSKNSAVHSLNSTKHTVNGAIRTMERRTQKISWYGIALNKVVKI